MNELMRRRMALTGAQKPQYEHGTWEDLFYHISRGDYATAYEVGETITMQYVGSGSIPMIIAAFDADALSSGSGTAPVTLIAGNCSERYNTGSTPWASCNARTYLNGTYYNKIPDEIKAHIVSVLKQTKTDGGTVEASETIWVPSYREMFGGTNYEASGARYTYFNSNARRIRNLSGTAIRYWLRSNYTTAGQFATIKSDGTAGSAAAGTTQNIPGLVPAFCVA